MSAAVLHGLWLLVFTLWTGGEIGLLLRTRENAQPGRNWDRGTLRLLWLTIVVAITIGQFLHGFAGPSSALRSPAVPLAALALLVSGVVLRFAAIRTLGRAFTVNVAIRNHQQVVQHGLYSLVRHPSYSALVLIIFAVGVQTANFLALAITFLPPLVALLWRIHVEEFALRSVLGQLYADYARRVRYRLIPGLW